MTQSRRPSPLQRRVLIVLAALDEKRPGPVLTRDLERVLERSGEAPVYGPNLRASCRRTEDAGWLRTLRAPNLQLAVELTDAGRAVAQPLLLAEQDCLRAEQRAAEVVVLPLVPADGTSATDLAVELNGMTYQACRGDFVVRLDGSTCLQLWNKEGRVVRPRAIRWKWRSGCRPVTMPEWRFVYRLMKASPRKNMPALSHGGSRLTFLRHQ